MKAPPISLPPMPHLGPDEPRPYERQLALLAGITRDLLSASPSAMGGAIRAALGRAAGHFGADAATLARRERDGRYRRVESWFDPVVGPFPIGSPEFISLDLAHWIRALVDRGRIGLIRHLDELPADAVGERFALHYVGAQSAAFVGIRNSDATAGYLSFFWRADRAADDVEVLSPLSVIGDVLVAADERANAELALSATDARLAAIVGSSDDAIVSMTPEFVITSWNPAAELLFGLSADEAVGQPISIVLPREQAIEIGKLLGKVSAGEETDEFEGVHTRPDGTQRDVMSRLFAIRDSAGSIVGLAAISRDITERNEAELARHAAEGRFRTLIEHAADGIVISGQDGWLSFASPAAGRLLGYEHDELVGMNWADILHPAHLQRALVIRDELRGGTREVTGFETQVRRGDGTWLWVELQLTNLHDDEAVLGSVINFRDISERKRFQEQLQHNALHDPLTSLANRLLLTDRIEHANGYAERENTSVGLLFLDLDHFKDINDSLGHPAGDEVLVDIAARLLAVVRPSDTVARFGGDEFVILVEDVASTAQLLALADRVRGVLSASFVLNDGREVHTTVSIGIVESALGSATPEALLRDADAAMYRAKAQGRDRYEVFDASIQAGVIAHLDTANALRHAIANNELRLYFQPIVEASSMQLIGFEALVRWQRSESLLVEPSEFVSIAEDTGLIVPIGAWVLEEACRQAAGWTNDFGAGLPSINVNLSIRQLRDTELAANLSRIIKATGIDARRITLEITETMLAENTTATLTTLNDLNDLGVHLSVDDFGTGYSSLAYLKRFPVDMLKIDRTFVSDLGKDPKANAIVNAIITLAHGLGLSVTGEGVENQRQLDELVHLGCDFAQGYFLGRPAPNEHWLHLAHKHWRSANRKRGRVATSR